MTVSNYRKQKTGGNNTMNQNISDYFTELYATQKAQQEARQAVAEEFKKQPLQLTETFLQYKEGKQTGIIKELASVFDTLTVQEAIALVQAVQNEAADIIKLTDKERYVHEQAFNSYDNAQKLLVEAEEAERMLKEYRIVPTVGTFSEMTVKTGGAE